jgi:ribosomal protein S18 acetylase RimI-like enzyme
MLAVQIRPAVAGDAEGISRVFLESAEHHARIDAGRYYVPDRQAIVERYRRGQQHPVAGPGAITLVAEVGGEIAGFLDARLDEPFDAMHRPMTYCFVADIAVAAAHRSLGIGQQLMRAAEEWGSRHGAEFVSLEYHVANHRAAAFYERMGYQPASMVAIKWL